MAIQLGVATRNARLEAIEAAIGISPTLTIRTGPPPANCGAANSGTVLATIVLPIDWMANASGGSKGIGGGPWQDVSADAGGTAAHFRVHTGGGSCEMQGTVGQGTGDLQLDNTVLVTGQQVSITGFTLTDANA